MSVLPLVVFQLLTAISGNGSGNTLARAGRRSVILLVVMMVSVALVAYAIGFPLVGLYSVDPNMVESIRASVLIPSGVQDRMAGSPSSMGNFLMALIPTNILEAAVRGDLLQILMVTVVFGLAVNRLPEDQRKVLAGVFRATSNAIMVVVQWILLATPIGVFALVMGLALATGADSMGLLGFYVVFDQGILMLIVLLLYPVTALLGRVGLVRLARAAVPPQVVALSTRSSIATMPAQIESGKKHLGFSETTSGFVVPLMVSTLKVQSAVHNPLRILFLAHIFGVSLTLPQFISFTAACLLISLGTVGVPNGGGSFRTLPAYMAVGVPVEGLVLLQAVKDIRDYLNTLANATGQFMASTILSRGDRAPGQGSGDSAPDRAGEGGGPERTADAA
jgi:Na+/H+-dicarboxylate symporter